MKLLVINGPNLNMLGQRNRQIYGQMTLSQLERQIEHYALSKGVQTEFFCCQYEGGIIEKIQNCNCDGIILNAGAYSHYSYAIRDAIECVPQKVVEVHLSDIFGREPFRAVRVFDEVVANFFYGKKEQSYFDAIDWFVGQAKG